MFCPWEKSFSAPIALELIQDNTFHTPKNSDFAFQLLKRSSESFEVLNNLSSMRKLTNTIKYTIPISKVRKSGNLTKIPWMKIPKYEKIQILGIKILRLKEIRNTTQVFPAFSNPDPRDSGILVFSIRDFLGFSYPDPRDFAISGVFRSSP